MHWSRRSSRDGPGCPCAGVRSSGTDNAMFRLGNDLCIRLPRTPGCAGQVEKDLRWLPRLAPHLPLAVPEPLELGRPGAGYPFTWGVYRWLDGEESAFELLTDPVGDAHVIAGFLKALQAIDAADAPRPGPSNFGRGVELARRDGRMRETIRRARGAGRPRDRTWQPSRHPGRNPRRGGVCRRACLDPWRPAARDLLVTGGRLSAVIDCAGLVAVTRQVTYYLRGACCAANHARPFARRPAWTRTPGCADAAGLCPSPSARCRTTGTPTPDSSACAAESPEVLAWRLINACIRPRSRGCSAGSSGRRAAESPTACSASDPPRCRWSAV